MSRLSAAELRDAAEPLVIALACAGDSPAFTELVKRRHQRVRKFMYHLCREPTLGDDLAQQVFLTAWRSLKQLRTAAAFDGWLKRIMVTTWLEELRRRKIAYVEELAPDNDPRAHFDAAAESIDLDAALGTLPPQVRLCVVLAHNEGMSHTEIAALTKLPLGTVKSHVTRGSARLRQVLAAYAGA
ncbi:MAG TPA: sigma-70 family RNA polymerase sigma factor [Gammaproteobacteria bacterium]|nr:sigma-70 family RNA polymerase sigma factor [Gammaproteobacteria bacterium]